jgi:hypothetical protein
VTTLQEAIELGQGVERPFRCTEHEDSHASASVNVVKGVWYCYVCHAKGGVDTKKAPTLDMLAQMLEPEKNCRIYPESYLELFGNDLPHTYWATRFPEWLIWHARLGEDPTSGEATFPVRTPAGRLAGVGRRQTDAAVKAAKEAGENPSRYKYPRRWSASQSLHGELLGPVLVLVEGAADETSLREVGVPARAHYGSALHYPQVEYLQRAKPKLILLGQDMDDAGNRGAIQSMNSLRDMDCDVARVTWPKNDPADCSPEQRLAALCSVVGEGYLPEWSSAVASMQAAFYDARDEMSA